jgi:hypothetical protein
MGEQQRGRDNNGQREDDEDFEVAHDGKDVRRRRATASWSWNLSTEN